MGNLEKKIFEKIADKIPLSPETLLQKKISFRNGVLATGLTTAGVTTAGYALKKYLDKRKQENINQY